MWILIGVAAWVLVLLFVLSLCAVAGRADREAEEALARRHRLRRVK